MRKPMFAIAGWASFLCAALAWNAPAMAQCVDNDGDGYGNPGAADCAEGAEEDCDDANAAVNPGASEVCDGLDNDCDGQAGPTEVDDDGDGWLACLECDDGNPLDNLDDADHDGYDTCHGDCDDDEAAIYPGAAEICDGLDNDCDETTDETADADGDGLTICDDDCDDAEPAVYPGAIEICDGLDNDCDERTDEDVDGDGDGESACDGDCNDLDPDVSTAGTEVCNGVDDNCDGSIDEGFDADLDGFVDGADADCAAAYAAEELDCDDADAAIHPDAVEDCEDEIDNNCDGLVDGDDEEACANLPPVADAGYDQQSRYLAGHVTLRFDGTNSADPEGTNLIYQWAIEEEPEGGVGSAKLITSTHSPYAFLVVDVDDMATGPWDFALSLTVTEDAGSGQASEADIVMGHIFIDDPMLAPGRCDASASGRPAPLGWFALLCGALVIAIRRR